MLYHSLAEDNQKYSTVRPADFARQMSYLYQSGQRPLITFDDGLRDFYLNAFPVLKKYNLPVIVFLSTSLIGGQMIYERDGLALDVLGEKEIKELADSGLVEFGSHAHHHLHLTDLTDDQLENELKISKEILEGILDKAVTKLAYPRGRVDERVKKLASKYYKQAYLIEPGCLIPAADQFLLPRNQIDSSVTLAQFKGIAGYKRIKFFGYGK